MRLSQAHLNVLALCPRQFQHIYLDRLAPPQPAPQADRLTQGSQFHQILQQEALGLPIDALLTAHPPIQAWFEAFRQQRSRLMILPIGKLLWQQSEQAQTLVMGEHVLTAVYDWVMVGDQAARIFDWKTYAKPRNTQSIQDNWQTKLYSYILFETNNLDPAQIDMIYCFFGPTAISTHQVRYSATQHQAIYQELQSLLDRLSLDLLAYGQTSSDFPQVEQEKGFCGDCVFARRCDRLDSPVVISPIDDIAEVPL
jgi:PD-(D/E)XK nuclease superfamily